MDKRNFQFRVFQSIKGKAPAEASLAADLAELLGISVDSAYRRLRGEKIISIDELFLICQYYKLSLDQLLDLNTGMICFQGNYLDPKTFRFDDYATSLLQAMRYMESFKQKELVYICKDVPIFHHFHLREIAAFKWFFWLKTYFQFPEFEKRKFKISDFPDEIFKTEQNVLNIYNSIPSTEIWSIENMNVFFRQIEFYRDGNVFESDEDAFKLYEILEKLWDHLEKQAAAGFKYNISDPVKKPLGEYKMYFNEVLLGDNSILAILDGVKQAYYSHTTINFMTTRDVTFTEYLFQHVQNQMKRSTLISSVSEKERSKFFRIIRERIKKRKDAIFG